jgi:hypothetical protein
MMNKLTEIAPAFVAMAQRIVWCSVLMRQGGKVLTWRA